MPVGAGLPEEEIRYILSTRKGGITDHSRVGGMVRFFMPKGVKMAKNDEKGEIVLYQPFNRDIKTIGKHITNALKEELKDLATVANFATVQSELWNSC